MLDNLITILTTLDPRFTIGWALIWLGVGFIICDLWWTWRKWQAKKATDAFINRVLTELEVSPNLGHVISYHLLPDAEQHMHCICGATSLNYKLEDPTAKNLMEQWSENHIATNMESAGR